MNKYLNEFLTDGRVIDYPWLLRQFLVRGIIVPLRYKNSAKTYREIWDEKKGSPLKFIYEFGLISRRMFPLGRFIFAMKYLAFLSSNQFAPNSLQSKSTKSKPTLFIATVIRIIWHLVMPTSMFRGYMEHNIR